MFAFAKPRTDRLQAAGSSLTVVRSADSDSERKYRPRKSQRRESLLIPRLLWFTVYVSLCYVAYKGMTYFSKPF